MAWEGVLVRFGEIGIKSPPVRRQMEERLRQNLEDALLRRRIEGHVRRLGPRLWMTGPDVGALADVAVHTFGVVSASPACIVEGTIDAIGTAAAALAVERDWASFAIRASRTGAHAFSSQDVAVQVGSAVYRAAEAAGRTPKVDLDHPDLEIRVEVREDKAYLSIDKILGPGGIPMGSQGKVVALLSDRASGVAAWLMMRRGCRIVPLYAGDSSGPSLDLLEPLWAWGLPGDIEVLPVCSGTVTKEVLLDAAARLAAEHKAEALVTGDTLDSHFVAPEGLTVLRPVCGLDPEEMERIATQIGIGPVDAPSRIAADATETVGSLLSMRRTVSE